MNKSKIYVLNVAMWLALAASGVLMYQDYNWQGFIVLVVAFFTSRHAQKLEEEEEDVQLDPEWIKTALDYLENDHIQENKHRLGILGSQDIDTIQWILRRELEKNNGTIARK